MFSFDKSRMENEYHELLHLFQVCHFLVQAISSAGVERGITGKVCLKSPDNNTNAFPIGRVFCLKSRSVSSDSSNEFLCAIVHSSQIKILHYYLSNSFEYNHGIYW